MKSKKSMIILVLVIFIFGMASVCASDVDDSPVGLSESEKMSEITLTDEIQTIGEVDNSQITGAPDDGTFYELDNQIKTSTDNIIKLDKNYTYEESGYDEGIKIEKSDITIDGQGHTIDAKGKARIFYVQADNVVIKNITFLNGSAMSDGGAVYFSGEGNVINCKFIDNKVIGDYACGGAVWMNSGSVENCKFINNTATNSGGAVWLYSGSVENCKFINNNAANNGGAVLFSGNGDVINCNFIGNNATWGSAIYFGWDDITRTISHSTFLNNKANVDAYTPLDVTLNDNYIEIIFIAQDNLINAIYSPVDVNFTNVTYWGAEGIANTDNFTPVRSNRESGQNITIEIYDSDDNLVDNVTLITDDNGQVKYDSLELKNGNYKYKIYHQEDYYYTYSEINDDFNVDLGDFNRLQAEINRVNANSVLNLSRNYNFTIDKDENLREGIVIDKAIIINGNGCVIDAKEKARIFYVISSDVVLENITFINGNSSGNGGAVYFGDTGIVRNCNFTDNSASNNGGAVFFYSVGNVTNCNFIANSAYGDGGAVYFFDDGNVDDCNFYDNSADNAGAVLFVVDGIVDNCNFTDNSAFGDCGAVLIVRYGNATACNFINNTANIDGGAIAMSSGSIANCNFINNSASNSGGAVYFLNNGDVLNCNFTGNKAISASAICFFDLDASSIKSISNSLFLKNRANAYGSEPFNVTKNGNNIEITFKGQNNYLNAIYSKGDVNFTDVTYWGAEGITNTDSFTPVRSNSEAGQNITVKGVVEGNTINTIKCTDEEGKIVIEGAEDYLIIVSHEWDAYYTETVETMFTNMKFYANVTPVTTNNKTVNITAKSNIYNEIMQGKLVFILPNGTEINATCGNNGIWWAKYTFNEYGVYDVNVSYSGLLNVALSNATITISKINSTIKLDDITLSYAESRNVTVKTTGATAVTANINGINVTVVNNFTIPISGLGAGNYTLTVTTITEEDFNPVTATSKITVNKVDSTLAVDNIEFEYGSEGSGDVLFTGACMVIANVINQPKAVVNVNGKKITVSGLAAGTYTLNVTTVPDENHTVVSQTAVITVNKVNSTLMVDDVVLNYGDSINVTVTATGATGITAKINGTNVTVVNNFTVPISDLGAGNYTLTVTTIADGNHNPVTATSKITVNKVDSTLTVDNIEFEYGSEGSGDVSFTGAGAVIANVINQPKAVVNVNGKKITVSGLAAATYALNVTTVPDENHTAVSQTAAITVNKVNSSLTVDDVELYYGESKNVTVTVEGASGITAKIDGNAVVVDNLTIPISGLNAGNHTLTVTTIADANHNSVTKKVSITVNKASTEIILANETIYLKAGNKISDVAKLDPGDAGNLTFVSSDEDIVLAYDGTIWARIKGNATVTVSFEGNDNYEDAKNKTIIVYITPKDTSVSVENDTLYLKVNETYEFDPAVVPNFLAVEYLSGNESVARVTEYGLLRAVGEGTTIITLTVGDDVSYAVNTTNVTVIVSKVPVEITVDTDSLDLKVGDETVISAALIPADAGNVTFTSSNDSVVEVDDEGNVIAQGKGQAIITVSFAGDNMYAASQNKTVTVNVSLDDASVTVDNDTLDLKVGETCAINATKHPDTILLDITYTSSDNSVVTVDENGIVRAVGEGSAIITVEVGDDEIYALNSTNVTVKVSKIPTEITLTNESLDLMYNDIAGNLANLTPAGAGNLTFVSDNEDVVAVEDGYVIAVGAGKANVTVSFAGDDKYASAENKTIKVTVTAWDASVNVTKTSYELFIGESDTIVAITVPEGLKVRFESDDDEIISVDNDGKITALKKGNAIVYVSVGDNVVYKYDYSIVNVTVNKMPTEIASSSVSAVYNADKYLTVNLTDAKGNPLAGVNVNVDLNGAKNYTTDEKGQIKVSLKGLDPKTYAAGITFKGDAKYDGSAKDVKVTVKKATPMITAGAKTFKTTAKTKKYTITLKDNTGKAIKNAKVTLKVNGKTYKATTNSKGKATFKITKLNKKGSYKATVTYNGNKYYNKVTKKVSIKVISAWKTVSKGSKLKSTVKEIQRALKNNGYYLTEKGHYLMVDGIYWDYTVKAVKQFQKAKGLKATGKVDEKTAKKLKII